MIQSYAPEGNYILTYKKVWECDKNFIPSFLLVSTPQMHRPLHSCNGEQISFYIRSTGEYVAISCDKPPWFRVGV